MRRLGAALAAVVITLLTAGPALAAEPVWERIPCSSGNLDTALLDRTKEGGDFLTLAGQLDCAEPKGVASFGYAIYQSAFAHGLVYESHLRPYATVGASPFADRKQVPAGPVDFGICVVTDYLVRIQCVRVVWDLLDAALDVRWLSTTDPLVDRTVRLVSSDWGPRPVCGTCW
ncbi:hypothetical protein [Plantactinospora endophytica]|uniref:Uncharacterized protein n=1 Tax=Plantactinospora endophytica TaxID=673535 RepID=A0ABQ4E0G1_9ACTN|nr:hypothetical protein [Plantactinospora endophytica]GIG88195.1 hypothetical protein Pen02_31310 [Plantactinospora endophytica]